MQPLKEIFSLIKPRFEREKEQIYFNGILTNRWKSNEEASKSIWPETTEINRKIYLSRLKRNVLNQTVKSTLLAKGNTPYRAAFLDCWRKLAAVHILGGLGLRKGSIWMAKHTLKKAIQYEFTEIVVSLVRALELKESVSGSPKEYDKYSKLVDHFEELYAAENKAVRYFTQLSSFFSNSKADDSEMIELVDGFINDLEKDLKTYPSYRYTYYTLHLMATHAQLINDHNALGNICKDAINFFSNKDYPIPRTVKFTFTFKPITAALQLKDYTAAQKYIDSALTMVDDGSYNQIICLIYQAILGFHSDQPKLVQSAIRANTNRKKFPAVEEQWKIIEAYAHLKDIDIGHKFKLSRFLNEVPIYSKDKRGNNISIIVLQMLFHLKLNERGKIIDKMETLATYSYRYLRKDDTFRGNCFIRMLSCIPKAHFNAIALERHAKKYTDQLGTYQGGEIEIIPYEKLWQLVLEYLGTGRR